MLAKAGVAKKTHMQSNKGPGRPKIISERTKRYLERELLKMREEVGSFHISDLMQSTGMPYRIASERTVRRALQKEGYGNYNSRKKGVLSLEDLKERVSFAKQMVKKYPSKFWTHDVAFFLDAVHFVFKTQPLSHSSTPSSKIWRKRCEGLKRSCTAKGRKEGTGGKYVKILAAISYNKGFILCEPYEQMTGEYFATFVRTHFNDMFEDAGKDSYTWVQDGDRSQNSAQAKQAMKDVNAHLLSIPPRSPDINPIENVFHLVQKKLRKEAVQHHIERETLPQFEKRVGETGAKWHPGRIGTPCVSAHVAVANLWR